MQPFVNHQRIAVMVFTLIVPAELFAADRTTPDSQTIERLIADLGDKNFKVRDEAVRRLIELEPTSALKVALKSVDPEIARLAAKIMDNLDRLATARSLEKLRKETAEGASSRAIDRFARWKGPDNDEAAWQVVIDFAWDVANRATKNHPTENLFWLKDRSPPKNTKPYGPKGLVDYVYSENRLALSKSITGFVRADGIVFKPGAKPIGVVVTSDGFEMGLELEYNTIILVAGSLRCGASLFNCILICDGEVELRSSVAGSIIVANGPVKYTSSIVGSVIVSSGTISSVRKSIDRSVLRENEPNPFGFVKWFTPAEVGLEVATDKDGVRVERLQEGKLPTESGLKVGDLIVTLDGIKIDSTEKFRQRLLRGVVNERCILMVKRDDRMFDIKLDFRAEELAAKQKKDR